MGIIYVSHRLDEIFRIADRAVVLRDGLLAGIRDIAHTSPEELIHLIVGRRTRQVVRHAARICEPLMAVDALETARAGPVSFDLRKGEILGLAGLRGAGHEEIGRALFGVEPCAGRVLLDGAVLDLSSPATAMAAGIGLIARDRVEESLAPTLTIAENMFLNPAATGRGRFEWRFPATERGEAAELGAGVGLRPNAPELPAGALSGGNQQKVVVARWLATGRKVLIAEDPTAGVDIGAKADIYALIGSALARGLGVIVISTDFEEVAAICHRVLVFSRGGITGEIEGIRLTTENIVQAASACETTLH